MSEHKCCARVIPRERFGGFHAHDCGKRAKIERDGKWYCGIHDPAKREALETKWKEQWAEKREAAAHDRAALSATAGLSTATLTALAEAGGVKRVLEDVMILKLLLSDCMSLHEPSLNSEGSLWTASKQRGMQRAIDGELSGKERELELQRARLLLEKLGGKG